MTSRSVLLALAVLLASDPAPASAQVAGPADGGPSWAVVPSLGLAMVRDGREWASAGAEVTLEVEHGGAAWRWHVQGSMRGLGVGCSASDLVPGANPRPCHDSGPGVAAGVARSVGPLWIGAGAAWTDRGEERRLAPYLRASVDVEPLRLELRLEVPELDGSRAYLPLLIGVPIRR